jgi:hypothetical protein
MSTNPTGPHLTEHLCIDLVLDLLPEKEAEAAMRHMAACHGCEERFREISAEWERLSARAGELGPHTSAATDAVGKSVGSRENLLNRIARAFAGPRGRLGLAAGAVAIALLILLPIRRTDPNQGLLQRLPALDTPTQKRGALRSIQNEATLEGLDAYARGDYDDAARHLSEVTTSGPEDYLRRVYLGSSLARTKEYAEAVEVLEDLSFDLIPEPWAGEARWTLYVALAAAGHDARADSLLAILAKEPGEIGSRARNVGHEE